MLTNYLPKQEAEVKKKKRNQDFKTMTFSEKETEGEITGKEMVQRREICLANWFHANEAEPVRRKHTSMKWLSVPEASLAVADS